MMNNNHKNKTSKNYRRRKKKVNAMKYVVPAIGVMVLFSLIIVIMYTFGSKFKTKFVEEVMPNVSVETKNIEGELPAEVTFIDAAREIFTFRVEKRANMTNFDKEKFKLVNNRMTYTDSSKYKYKSGIDISEFQGNIDWNRVKADGIDFAIIRIGYRGYSEGVLSLDSRFKENIAGAKAAGIDVGVYIFSQAISKKEAREEAQFVIDNLAGEELQYPVFYDPETIYWDEARTDDLSRKILTNCTLEFCKCIEEAGYKAGLYANLNWQAFKLNMYELKDTMMWYADYIEKPQTPYAFKMWQYASDGKVDGIKGDVDMDIELFDVRGAED